MTPKIRQLSSSKRGKVRDGKNIGKPYSSPGPVICCVEKIQSFIVPWMKQKYVSLCVFVLPAPKVREVFMLPNPYEFLAQFNIPMLNRP